MVVLASALMLMLCMLKAKENPNFPESLSHKHKHQAKINLMHGHSQDQRPVIDGEKCPCMEYWNALLHSVSQLWQKWTLWQGVQKKSKSKLNL